MILLLAIVTAALASNDTPNDRQGHNQSPLVPTSTYLPIDDDFAFTVERINLTDDPILFDNQEIDGFSITDFTYVTQYPEGLDFTVNITPPDEDTEIASVTLLYKFVAGTQGRTRASLTEDNLWQAIPFDTRGLAPWLDMEVSWRVSYGAEGVFETEPVTVQYIDHTREWWRAESDDVILYWFDFPEEFGQVVVEAFAHVRDRYIQGFGGLLPFKPTVVIFPPGDSLGEWQAGGQVNPRTTGQAQSETYSATLRVRGLEIEEIRKDCIWNEERDLEWQMRYSASVATHEVAHLYQFAFGSRGPAWWIEGEATFFELEIGPVDQRLQNLATMGEDLSTLQGLGPSGQVGTPAIDGCTHLGYDMGASFINWLVSTQGGFETHRQIVDLLSRNVTLPNAIEQVIGVDFLTLERQWREYIGLNPDPFIPTQPAMQFPPTVTPFGQ
jgi:hypothetical protein